ncbi:MAG: glycine cleavage system aminomethyltransferase GcvT [Candidatus Dormibacteraeota bacterium]|nr:glycine cleavage system aminomethyltransferase GcvT [Candidatus Dormibacteraeota bacterium]
MLRTTPLAGRHLKAGAHMVDFAGWEMPQQYTGVRAEQRAVRTATGVFDVSHMGRFEVRGDAPGEFLQTVVTNDVARLEPGQAQYNLMCAPDGGVIDDLVVYRAAERWPVVVNAANREKDLAWFRAHAPAGTEVVDLSAETCLLAVQGPMAAATLGSLEGAVVGIPHFGVAETLIAGSRCLVSRTGYTGEDGFELFVPATECDRVWDGLLAAGAVPCGLACRDVCRLEAGLRLYGNDMDESVNPYEAGLGWTVKLEKGEFIGRAKLAEVREAGAARQLAGLRGAGRTIPRHDADVYLGERWLGRVTSGTYSFWLEAGIGFALVEAGAVEAGSKVAIAARGGRAEAVVQALPFYRGSAGRVTGPATGRPASPV